jgi:hypothetical protein
MAPAYMPPIRCKVCDMGFLEKKRDYRMSIVVVVIGYLLLVPSVLGMLFSAAMLSLAVYSTSGVHGAGAAPGAIVGGIFLMFGLACLVGGLLGWVLVMKKEILQCNHCTAVIAAS